LYRAPKDGKPVKSSPRLKSLSDSLLSSSTPKKEKQRTQFNVALHDSASDNPKVKERAIKSMQELSEQQFVAAMYLVGMWEIGWGRTFRQIPPMA